jgi:tripeptide aminopeptidase
MELKNLKEEHRLINLFVDLAEIPSPSLKEKELCDTILDIMGIYGIKAFCDSYGNIIAKILPSPEYNDVQPILLSAHMDVVGGSEKVNVKLSKDGNFIETDKTRTLGADNKAGVATILDLAIELNSLDSKIKHGPVEITFTRDEEKGMTGIRNLDTSKLSSKYAIIADGEYLGELDTEGAGFTNVYVTIHSGKGGHSGINIADVKRINAIKVLSEFDVKIPQGVYKQDERGVITSINAGTAVGGTAGTCIAEIIKNACEFGKNKENLPEEYSSKNIMQTINTESALNVISTEAYQAYSIRSSDPENEKELIELIKDAAKELNNKYSGLIRIDVSVEHHLKPFVKSQDEFLSSSIVEAAEKNAIKCVPSSFHAGAETHVLANEKTNSKNEQFIPVIVGIANLVNIHSSDEQMDWKSFLRGRKWLEDIVVAFAEKQKDIL